MNMSVEITDANFDELVASGKPVLVDFWAEWCMPCKMMAPAIDELATEFEGSAIIGKCDTDNNRDTAMKFGVSAIPTVVILKDGEMVKKFVGLQQKADLKAAIEEVLA